VTRIEWQYSPPTFFEDRAEHRFASGTVTLDGGLAIFLPDRPREFTDTDVAAITEQLRTVLDVRRFQTNGTAYTLGGRNVIHEYADGRRDGTAQVEGVEVKAQCGLADAVSYDSNGKLIADTKAERSARDADERVTLSAECHSSPRLRSMIASFNAATDEPDVALVRLFEVWDAAADEFGKHKAAAVLGLDKDDWNTLKTIACDGRIREGRHRGLAAPDLRPASTKELAEARRIVVQIIRAFAALPPPP
jgi:hypothetical protein